MLIFNGKTKQNHLQANVKLRKTMATSFKQASTIVNKRQQKYTEVSKTNKRRHQSTTVNQSQ